MSENWQMDSVESSAVMEVTPIRKLDGTIKFSIHTALKIRPYPNPLSYGGFYGFGEAANESELNKHKESFLKNMEQYKKLGLEKIEINTKMELQERPRQCTLKI